MKENNDSYYEKELNSKIEERLSKMESPDYVFAKRFSKVDYLITFVVIATCLVILIVGSYL